MSGEFQEALSASVILPDSRASSDSSRLRACATEPGGGGVSQVSAERSWCPPGCKFQDELREICVEDLGLSVWYAMALRVLGPQPVTNTGLRRPARPAR